MPIIGMNIQEIHAKLDEKKIMGNLEIKSTPNIENVNKKKMNFAGVNEVLLIDFSFKTEYGPDNAAEIVFKGNILYQTNKADSIAKEWKEKKLFDEDVTVEVMNALFRRCLSKSVQIADDMRLPPPVTFPIVAKKPAEKGTEKTGKDGKEKK